MFEVLGFATDDGEAGLSGRKRTAINLQVRYDVPQSIGFLQLMMNEDASKLIDTLKGPDYVLATSGIVSLIPGSPTGVPSTGSAHATGSCAATSSSSATCAAARRPRRGACSCAASSGRGATGVLGVDFCHSCVSKGLSQSFGKILAIPCNPCERNLTGFPSFPSGLPAARR